MTQSIKILTEEQQKRIDENIATKLLSMGAGGAGGARLGSEVFGTPGALAGGLLGALFGGSVHKAFKQEAKKPLHEIMEKFTDKQIKDAFSNFKELTGNKPNNSDDRKLALIKYAKDNNIKI